MLPWVMLGILLAIGLLASVIYTSVVFYIDGDSFNGNLWLIVGLVALGKCKNFHGVSDIRITYLICKIVLTCTNVVILQ